MSTRTRQSSKWLIWTCLFLQSNNDILLPAMTAAVSPMITLNNDSAESVQKAALNHFKASTFTSYTELTPEDSTMLLVLRQKDNQAGGDANFFFSQHNIKLNLSFYCVKWNRNSALKEAFFFFVFLPLIQRQKRAQDQLFPSQRMPLIRCLSSCSSTPPQTTALLWTLTLKCRLTREFMPRQEITPRRSRFQRPLPGFTAHFLYPFWQIPTFSVSCRFQGTH